MIDTLPKPAGPISVVLVTHQSGATLPLVLRQVLKQADVGEIVVMDNGERAQALEAVRAIAATDLRVRLVTGHGNIGFAAAVNRAVPGTSGEYVCLLQADTFLNDDTLALLLRALRGHGNDAIAAPLLLNPDGSEQKGGRMRFMNAQNALVEAGKVYKWSMQAKETRVFLHLTPTPESTVEVDAVGSACLLMKRDIFTRLGGMDEQFFLHFEDMDFCQRASRANIARLFVPGAPVVHLRTSSRAGLASVEWQRRKSFQRYFTLYSPTAKTPTRLALQAFTLLWLALKIVRVRIAAYLPESTGVRAARRIVVLYRYLQEQVAEQTLAGKTILLTGATNQVGVCLLGHLLSRGAEVVAVTHQTRVPFRHPHLHWVPGDLRQGKIRLEGYRPELMIHAAELWLLPPSMPAIAGSSITRVIAFGSAKVFAKVYADHSREQAEIERLEQSEINAVKACKQNGIRWTIFRPTMIYGVGLDHTVMQIADAARRFGVALIDPPAKGRRQPVHADDLAEAVLNVMDNPKTLDKAYNLSGGEVLEYRAMIERIMAALGRRPRLWEVSFLPDWMDKVGRFLGKENLHGEHLRQMNQDMTMPYGEAQKDFGYHPRPFLTGGATDLGQF